MTLNSYLKFYVLPLQNIVLLTLFSFQWGSQTGPLMESLFMWHQLGKKSPEKQISYSLTFNFTMSFFVSLTPFSSNYLKSVFKCFISTEIQTDIPSQLHCWTCGFLEHSSPLPLSQVYAKDTTANMYGLILTNVYYCYLLKLTKPILAAAFHT